MCRRNAEGGRRCPGCSSPEAQQAHNDRRSRNRAERREIVESAVVDGVDQDVVAALKASPPSVARAWREQRDQLGEPEVASVEDAFTRRYGTVEEKIAAFQDELNKKIQTLGEDKNWLAYLGTMSRFHRYSLNNQLLILIQRPDATQVAGFNKWKELGRHVCRGERGMSILAPQVVRSALKDENGAPVLGKDGKPLKSQRVVGFKAVKVFDIAQTDGKPLPQPPGANLSEEPPAGFREDLEKAVRDAGYSVVYSDSIAAEGATNPKEQTVTIASRLTPALQAATLAHELGHIRAGHLERTAEYHTGHGGQRGQMEIEAESIAYAVCRANGMSTQLGDASGSYVAGWSRSAPEGAVKESAQRVSAVVKEILTSSGWRNIDEGEAA